jgi:hypothetical protein
MIDDSALVIEHKAKFKPADEMYMQCRISVCREHEET